MRNTYIYVCLCLHLSLKVFVYHVCLCLHLFWRFLLTIFAGSVFGILAIGSRFWLMTVCQRTRGVLFIFILQIPPNSGLPCWKKPMQSKFLQLPPNNLYSNNLDTLRTLTRSVWYYTFKVVCNKFLMILWSRWTKKQNKLKDLMKIQKHPEKIWKTESSGKKHWLICEK